MNIIELKEFLEQFQVKELKINEFLQNKKIIEINNNFFLIKNDDKLNKNQVFQDTLIYIQLKDMLPSKYLLEFINKNSNSKVELKGEKQAINFTYGKNLSLE
ncbi:MAG: hypothetical protein KC550_04805, partial [Nanoarchaeota archaeon]|nr:hypothetical protein [Nanoarchaeota archaeon]